MRRLSCALLVTVTGACADQPEVIQPAHLLNATKPEPRYELTKIDETLGGSVAVGAAINNRGWIAGYSRLADNTQHALLWRDGTLDGLGTLGGPNSAVVWPGLNNEGMVVGISQTDEVDPNGESWSCEAFIPASDRTCVGFVWHRGVMDPLPTHGGPNGFAAMANDRGQVVGWAENLVEDPTCHAPQKLQFRAALWDPKRGTVQELPPLPGDSISAATAINNRGIAVGISGKCFVAVGDSSARASVIWEKGRAFEIPNLGGDTWNTPMDINERGHVVGFSNRGNDAAGNPRLFAFLWTGGGKALDLGGLHDDDTLSQAYGINARGQIVGRACGPAGCRAFLYDKGTMHDLNDLVDAGDDQLTLARHINDAGVITGHLVEAGTNRTLIFTAKPNGRR